MTRYKVLEKAAIAEIGSWELSDVVDFATEQLIERLDSCYYGRLNEKKLVSRVYIDVYGGEDSPHEALEQTVKAFEGVLTKEEVKALLKEMAE